MIMGKQAAVIAAEYPVERSAFWRRKRPVVPELVECGEFAIELFIPNHDT